MINRELAFFYLSGMSLEELSQAVVSLSSGGSRSSDSDCVARVAFLLDTWTRLNAIRVAATMTQLLSLEEIQDMFEASEAGLLEQDKGVTEH